MLWTDPDPFFEEKRSDFDPVFERPRIFIRSPTELGSIFIRIWIRIQDQLGSTTPELFYTQKGTRPFFQSVMSFFLSLLACLFSRFCHSVCPVPLHVCPSFFLSLCMSVYFFLSLCVSVSLFCLSVYFFYLCACLSIFFCLSACLSI